MTKVMIMSEEGLEMLVPVEQSLFRIPEEGDLIGIRFPLLGGGFEQAHVYRVISCEVDWGQLPEPPPDDTSVVIALEPAAVTLHVVRDYTTE